MKSDIQAELKSTWQEAAASLCLPLVLELFLHMIVYGEISPRIIYPCIFALTAGCFLLLVSTPFAPRVNKIIFLSLSSLITLYFEIQFVYNSIFGEFMSFWQFSFGAEAVTNFWQQMLYGIGKALPQILLLLLPQAALFVLVLRGKWGLEFQKRRWPVQAAAACALAALHLSALGAMLLSDNGTFSAYRLYKNPNTATEISVKNIGLLSTARLECKYLLMSGTAEASASYYSDGEKVSIDVSEMGKSNMLDLDFDALSAETDSDVLKSLDQYFSQQEPTAKNEYTGIFEGYNLITICAEAFSPYLIDPERTPALYELSTNGFVFNNYFGSFPNNTTNGEYTFCMGLYPDLSRKKSMASFHASQNNYLPFCLGNLFKNAGAGTWAYHNYAGDYYSRDVTHPNMGYTFKSATDGLDMELGWPSSDLEMMEKSVGDYINSGEQFCAYYMTFSGHYQYNWENPMSLKNRDVVEDLPYSDTVKAYIACNMELEYALEYLMDQLEAAGIADRTVIVLTNDHYPYGLTEAEYNELAGRTVDTTFEKYRNSFICYIPDVSIPVDTYCSTADILPTLLNLFGFPYDSRLLAGKDVLSEDANNYAVLADQSFVTADFGFDTSSGKVTYFSEGQDHAAAEEQIAAIQEEIADQFLMSADVLESDYYAHALFGKMDGVSEVDDYPFTDIPATFSLGALDFVYGNGYMDAVSSTKFGFGLLGTYAEFLNVLYGASNPGVKMDTGSGPAGSGTEPAEKFAPAISWAEENGLIDPSVSSIDASTPIFRKNAAMSFYACAEHLGLDTAVDEALVSQYAELYPHYTEDEVRAIYWCFHKAVIRGSGTVESVFETAGNQMTRNQIVISTYNYNLYVLQQS